ncbi:hypothetical protein JYU14_03460 [Simkania negevensis]|uniref:Type II secretion system protein n=1 Tax=Simkania negevensis TaxID=83561 RepID=A0ABS3ASL8_9BACT|nr:hypothetical protein [Simkania negevensis]
MSSPLKKERLHKARYYFLLEVLVALALVAFGMGILFRPMVASISQGAERIQDIRLEAAADLAALEVKWMLFQNEIPWKELSKRIKQGGKGRYLKTISLPSPSKKEQHWTIAYSLLCEKRMYKNPNPDYRLVDIELILSPTKNGNKERSYHYHILAEKRIAE